MERRGLGRSASASNGSMKVRRRSDFLSVDIGFYVICCLFLFPALSVCLKERFELNHVADEVIRVIFLYSTLFQLIFVRAFPQMRLYVMRIGDFNFPDLETA